MRIEIRLLFHLRRYAPQNAEVLTMDFEAGAGLGQLIDRLAIPPDVQFIALINGRPGRDDTPLHDGDVVTFLPRVEGG